MFLIELSPETYLFPETTQIPTPRELGKYICKEWDRLIKIKILSNPKGIRFNKAFIVMIQLHFLDYFKNIQQFCTNMFSYAILQQKLN